MLRIFFTVILFFSVQAIAAESAQNGRYQIVTTPGMTTAFLLDTQTGKTWQFVHFDFLYGDPTVWQAVDRVDDSGGKLTLEWTSRHATKKQVEESEAAQKAQTQKYIDQNLKP